MQLSLYAPVGACRLETGHALEHAVFLCEKLGGSAIFHDLAVDWLGWVCYLYSLSIVDGVTD